MRQLLFEKICLNSLVIFVKRIICEKCTNKRLVFQANKIFNLNKNFFLQEVLKNVVMVCISEQHLNRKYFKKGMKKADLNF